MEPVTIEEIQQYIGGFWLENKKQAEKISLLEDEIRRLKEIIIAMENKSIEDGHNG